MSLYIVETQRDGRPWARLAVYANEATAVEHAEHARAAGSGVSSGRRILPLYDAVRVRKGPAVIWRTVSEQAS